MLSGAAPDGTYEGHWLQFRITFTAGAVEHTVATSFGPRHFRAVPCTVTVEGGRVTRAVMDGVQG